MGSCREFFCNANKIIIRVYRTIFVRIEVEKLTRKIFFDKMNCYGIIAIDFVIAPSTERFFRVKRVFLKSNVKASWIDFSISRTMFELSLCCQ